MLSPSPPSPRLGTKVCSMVVAMLLRAIRASRKKSVGNKGQFKSSMSRAPRENSHNKTTKATAVENVVMACLLPSTHQALNSERAICFVRRRDYFVTSQLLGMQLPETTQVWSSSDLSLQSRKSTVLNTSKGRFYQQGVHARNFIVTRLICHLLRLFQLWCFWQALDVRTL